MIPEHAKPPQPASPSDRASRPTWRIWAPLLVLWGLGAATLVAMALYSSAWTVYDATAWLHVNDTMPVFNGTGATGGDFRRFMLTQMQLVTSPDVLGATLANHPELLAQPLLRAEANPEAEIRRMLRVQLVPETNFFTVSLSSESPAEAQAIVDAVVESYLKVANNRADRDTRARIERLQREVGVLDAKIQAKRDQLHEMVNVVGVTIDDALKVRGRVSLERFNRHLSDLDTARLNRMRLEAELEAARPFITKGKVDGAASGTRSREQPVVPKLSVLESLARSQLDNIGRDEADQTSVHAEGQAKDLDIRLAALRKEPAQEDRVDEGEREFRRIEAELAVAVNVEHELQAMLKDVEQELQAVPKDVQLDGENREGKALRIEFARIEFESDVRMRQTIRDHISQLEFESKGPQRVERGAEKTQVEVHTSPLRMITTGAAVLGMLLLSTLSFWLGVRNGRAGVMPADERSGSEAPSEREP